ncbi:alkylated DNA repair protein [Rhodococcus rhodnii LMG 5362]|uniref:Alkylated DNA repair protein n=1 Tax=Rhodococcus rhodnii LMG 5362 TaxID=1273125 RepID=R7WMK8_9NOCA|nr:alkylated DNA repair protein [Rhodococcus rhodnii LMG 5362]
MRRRRAACEDSMMMLFGDEPVHREPIRPADGAALVPAWLTLEQQAWLVRRFEEWTSGPVPIRSAAVRGHRMSARTVCLGRRALAEAGYSERETDSYTPDVALANYYDDDARMGMHQDKDERSLAPVVSLSIGSACTFRFGNTANRNKPYTDLPLHSGDLFVFGGASRLAYHGVTRIHPFTAPEGCGLDTGRINITMRMTGLDGWRRPRGSPVERDPGHAPAHVSSEAVNVLARPPATSRLGGSAMTTNSNDVRQLSPTCGLRVSPLTLGAITFGGAHGMEHMGHVDVDGATELLRIALDAGVTMVDVANMYSLGVAEEVLGQALASSRDFDRLLVTSKVRMVVGDGPNDGGHSRWHILDQIDKTLSRLGRDHLDLYYLHEWDGQTPLEEAMGTMDALVRSGKIRYYGVSNYTSWQLMKALMVCERHGFVKPVAQQIYYNAAAREAEYEMIPAALDQGIGSQPWSPVGMGLLTGKYRRDRQPESGARLVDGDGTDLRIPDREKVFQVVDALEDVAARSNATITQVALAWLLTRPGVTNVVVGARTAEQLTDSLGATTLTLDESDVQQISATAPPPIRYPFWHQADLASDRLGEADRSIIATTASQL